MKYEERQAVQTRLNATFQAAMQAKPVARVERPNEPAKAEAKRLDRFLRVQNACSAVYGRRS